MPLRRPLSLVQLLSLPKCSVRHSLMAGHSAPDLSPFLLLENVAMASPLWKNHTIESRTRVWENEKLLYVSVWLKKGSRLTGYVFTYSPAGCTILLFIFFIESGLEGKNSCSYAPGRDLL